MFDTIFALCSTIAGLGSPTALPGGVPPATHTATGSLITKLHHQSNNNDFIISSCSEDSIILTYRNGQGGALHPGNVLLHLGREQEQEERRAESDILAPPLLERDDSMIIQYEDNDCNIDIFARIILSSEVLNANNMSNIQSNNTESVTIKYATTHAAIKDVFPNEIWDPYVAELPMETILSGSFHNNMVGSDGISGITTSRSRSSYQRILGDDGGGGDDCVVTVGDVGWILVAYPCFIPLYPWFIVIIAYSICLCEFEALSLLLLLTLPAALVCLPFWPLLCPIGAFLLFLGLTLGGESCTDVQNFLNLNQQQIGDLLNYYSDNNNSGDARRNLAPKLEQIRSTNHSGNLYNDIGFCLESLSWSNDETKGNNDVDLSYLFLLFFEDNNDDSQLMFSRLLSETCMMRDQCNSSSDMLDDDIHICEQKHFYSMMDEMCPRGLTSDTVMAFPLTREFVYHDCHMLSLLLYLVGKLLVKT